jgi:hypothetical protein
MPKKLPVRDPIAGHRRKVLAARRVGPNARCACGETRPEALIREKQRVICHECKRKERGMKTTDDHDFAGRANSRVTIPVPVNDHRAELSVSQYDWPKQTWENPDGSPLLAAAGCIRGFIDTVLYLMEKGMTWIAEMLEKLDHLLAEKLGPQWWVKTDIEQFAPQGKSHGQS